MDFCHSVDVLQGFPGVSVTESIHKAGRQPEEDAREVCLFIGMYGLCMTIGMNDIAGAGI